MKRITIRNYDTPHPYVVYYRAWLVHEAEDGWRVWHPLFHPFTKWIPRNSIDRQVENE